jgi:uncharacterized protein (TIGR02118 family)
VLYPNKDGAKFDMDYYLTSHIPMLKRELGSALKGCIVEQGLGGRADGTKAEFAVLCHLRFDSVESYQQAIGPVGEQIRQRRGELCERSADHPAQRRDSRVLISDRGFGWHAPASSRRA